MGGTNPMAGLLACVKERGLSSSHAFIALLLTVDVASPAASGSCCFDFPTTMYPELGAETNPFSLEWFCHQQQGTSEAVCWHSQPLPWWRLEVC